MRTAASLKEGAQMQTVNAASAASDPPVQGVFLMQTDGGKLRSKFMPVTTGITGATEIEVTSGLREGDEVVIGPYKVLRILKNEAKLKRDTAAATGTEFESS